MDHGNQLATIVRDLEFSEIWPFWRPGLNPILWMLSLSRGGGARRLSERWWAKAVRITHFLVPFDTNSVDPKPKNHQCRAQIVTLNPSAQSSPWINGTSSLKAWNASSLLADVAAVWAICWVLLSVSPVMTLWIRLAWLFGSWACLGVLYPKDYM